MLDAGHARLCLPTFDEKRLMWPEQTLVHGRAACGSAGSGFTFEKSKLVFVEFQNASCSKLIRH